MLDVAQQCDFHRVSEKEIRCIGEKVVGFFKIEVFCQLN